MCNWETDLWNILYWRNQTQSGVNIRINTLSCGPDIIHFLGAVAMKQKSISENLSKHSVQTADDSNKIASKML